MSASGYTGYLPPLPVDVAVDMHAAQSGQTGNHAPVQNDPRPAAQAASPAALLSPNAVLRQRAAFARHIVRSSAAAPAVAPVLVPRGLALVSDGTQRKNENGHMVGCYLRIAPHQVPGATSYADQISECPSLADYDTAYGFDQSADEIRRQTFQNEQQQHDWTIPAEHYAQQSVHAADKGLKKHGWTWDGESGKFLRTYLSQQSVQAGDETIYFRQVELWEFEYGGVQTETLPEELAHQQVTYLDAEGREIQVEATQAGRLYRIAITNWIEIAAEYYLCYMDNDVFSVDGHGSSKQRADAIELTPDMPRIGLYAPDGKTLFAPSDNNQMPAFSPLSTHALNADGDHIVQVFEQEPQPRSILLENDQRIPFAPGKTSTLTVLRRHAGSKQPGYVSNIALSRGTEIPNKYDSKRNIAFAVYDHRKDIVSLRKSHETEATDAPSMADLLRKLHDYRYAVAEFPLCRSLSAASMVYGIGNNLPAGSTPSGVFNLTRGMEITVAG